METGPQLGSLARRDGRSLRCAAIAWLFLVAAVSAEAACLDGEPVFTPDFSTGPVTFDFEDGLQGWTVDGGAERVETGVLGGAWAVFGDGREATWQGLDLIEGIFIETLVAPTLGRCIDVTDVAELQLDVFLTTPSDAGQRDPALLITFVLESVLVGGERAFERMDPEANPGFLRADLSDLEGEVHVTIAWASSSPTDPTTGASFVDEVTLLPAPEPGATPGTAAAAAVLAAIDQRRRRRARTREDPPR